ncbi:hypothetical protein C9374_007946 [Naegleria lovaniensis]|uniref:Glycosyltransferase family 18 catalytic domain-containing protein n=1 Tax=Naegleria lovaniensis TaxID=51637 RepID=A0AA88GHR7_NAELO|nr:uncharacterized protein C9374_007946 [Naegleria lovaniensis]KAG2378798.1 hypothetical protein C9374_007946 [Naegleria lovaniensis]
MSITRRRLFGRRKSFRRAHNLSIQKKSSTTAPSLCTLQFLIMTAPRENLKRLGHSPFMYLNRTMKGILDLETVFFKPCITLLNVKGKKFRKELESLYSFEKRNENSERMITIVDLDEKSQRDLVFTSVLLPLKKKQHLNDFYSIFNQIKFNYLDQLVMIMEDDFVMCPQATQHLVYIIHEMDRRKWSGVRVSFGLNGIMMNGNDLYAMVEFLRQHTGRATPVDWLLEEFWNQFDEMGMNYFGKSNRTFYTYRLQLMEHIGVESSLGHVRHNDLDFPKCYEAQIAAKLMFHFNMDQCSHSMFSPCDEVELELNSESRTEMRNTHGKSSIDQPSRPRLSSNNNNKLFLSLAHDQFHETQAFTPSATFSLAHFKSNVQAIFCQEGESCEHCCLRHGKKCDGTYFPYINHCSELRKYKPNCNCQREKYLISRAPYITRNVCFIGTRPSRFDCTTSKFMSSRLCPCT